MEEVKRYELLKELPLYPKGTIFYKRIKTYASAIVKDKTYTDITWTEKKEGYMIVDCIAALLNRVLVDQNLKSEEWLKLL